MALSGPKNQFYTPKEKQVICSSALSSNSSQLIDEFTKHLLTVVPPGWLQHILISCSIPMVICLILAYKCSLMPSPAHANSSNTISAGTKLGQELGSLLGS